MGKGDHYFAINCDYCVSPSPNNWVLGFCTLGLNSGSGFRAFSMLIYIYILVN